MDDIELYDYRHEQSRVVISTVQELVEERRMQFAPKDNGDNRQKE